MEQWNLIIDVAKCHNCNNCFLACKDEYVGNNFPGYSAPQPLHGHKWLFIESCERGQMPMVEVAFRPTTCNHCRQAPCVEQATGGSVYQREDGIVMIDPDKARGKKEIASSCPYDAIWWNEQEQLAQKWNFDAHLLDQGHSQLRAEQACPTGVFRSLKAEDHEMERIAEEQELQVLRPELGTRPRVYYKNLDWFTKHYIGGTLVSEANGTAVAASGVTVRLEKDGVQIQSAQTDQFGDFKFDGLEDHSGRYTLQYDSPRQGRCETSFEFNESVYLGIFSWSDSP